MTKFPAHPSHSESYRGFSLLELIVVVSIAGILVAVAVPSFINLIRTTRVKGTATYLYLAMFQARSEAIKRNVAVRITPDPNGWQMGWSIAAVGAASAVSAQGPINGVTISYSGPAGVTNVTYENSGRLSPGTTTATTPTFLISPQGSTSIQRCVSVDPSGRPYVKNGVC